jgi:CheY-like chemotaxis protein
VQSPFDTEGHLAPFVGKVGWRARARRVVSRLGTLFAPVRPEAGRLGGCDTQSGPKDSGARVVREEGVHMARRILLVEDNPQNRYLMTYLLESKGHVVDVAEDGEQALTILEDQVPDLILMDMQLPRVDGYEATRRIKADDRLRSVPLVALTAHSMKGDRARAVDAGCDAFVSKPVDAEEILALVERMTATT